LIAYADRLGGSIARLTELLRGPLRGAVGRVHLLPFYRPYDGADAGFDPKDHTEVDARLGTWNDIHTLAETHTIMADVIVNTCPLTRRSSATSSPTATLRRTTGCS
jgi:sucrose phosphorylase